MKITFVLFFTLHKILRNNYSYEKNIRIFLFFIYCSSAKNIFKKGK